MDTDTPILDDIRGVLPLEVGGATAGISFFNVRGPGERPNWWLTVTNKRWRLTRDGETVLTSTEQVEAYNNDRVEAYDKESVRFLVGTRMTDVEGDDPEEHGTVAFVFDDTYRLEIIPDDDDYEAWVLMAPEWFYVAY
jgi:hypothetical protein